MYKSFYHLDSNPFRLAPEPDFCFVHSGYKCAREYLEFALAQGEGFVMVTGRPGTGKTMLVETFLKGIDTSKVEARRIAVSSFGATDLLSAVAYAYGIEAAGLEQATLRHRIHEYFLKQERAGRRVLLIIDEAQTLSHTALEELRILADLQTRSHLMLQLFLVGQESLQDLMRSPEMEQFQQRVIANYRLVPLSLKETRAYIEHRLLQAGWQGDPAFTGEAVLGIYQLSQGVPRHINKICNRLLLLGYGKGSHLLDRQAVEEISVEMHEERLAPLSVDLAGDGDTGNVTRITDARDGQIAVAELAIPLDQLDDCAVAVPRISRVVGQNSEGFVPLQDNSPAPVDEPVVSPDIKGVAPVTVTAVPPDAANVSIAEEQPGERAVAKPRNSRFSTKESLTILGMMLVLLTVMVATVPSFPGYDRVRGLIASGDYVPRSSQPVADPVTRNGYPLAAGAIDRQASPDSRPVTAPVQAMPGLVSSGQGSIPTLLAKARQALEDYRLVTPEGDNAYGYFSAVLEREPRNESARAGIQEIVEIYITLATKAADNNELARAGRYLERGLEIEPHNPALLALKDSVDDRTAGIPATQDPATTAGVQVTHNRPVPVQPLLLKKRHPTGRRLEVPVVIVKGS